MEKNLSHNLLTMKLRPPLSTTHTAAYIPWYHFQHLLLPFESFGLAGREVLDLVSSLVKKASESLNIDFVLLLSYWKKRISTNSTSVCSKIYSGSISVKEKPPKKTRYCG